jgi:hypothetical protein
MWKMCGWGIVDIYVTFHMHAFDFFIPLHIDCQRNVNSILPTELPHKFSYIVATLIHNHFE